MGKQIKSDVNDKKTRFFRRKTGKKKLNKFLQTESDIYDQAIELYLKDKYTLFKYQGYNPLILRREDIQKKDHESESESRSGSGTETEQEVIQIEPDESSKLITDDFEIPEGDGQTFSRMEGWNGNMYIPPVFMNSYQLSIWKVDAFGVVKVINKYFTPKNNRANELKFPGFSLEISLDEQTMIAIERETDNQSNQIAIAFDPYSLEILSELTLNTVDITIRNQPYYQGQISEVLPNYECHYKLADQVPKITSWNFGEYVI
jgi:hypothetical protein